MAPLKAYLVCSGLGHINRGYESFTRECFDALKSRDDLDLKLFKGAGDVGLNERSIFNLPRKSLAAGVLGAAILRGAPRTTPRRYYGEAYSFGTSLLPHLLRDRPDIVFFSDVPVGELLLFWRKLFRLSYKLLLRNGAPNPPNSFKLISRDGAPNSSGSIRWDHINQISPEHFEEAIRAGIPASSQTLLPSGFKIEPTIEPLSSDAKMALRQSLGLPAIGRIVLSVGVISPGGHKRLEYLIEELASIPEPRPFLVMLGDKDKGADEIERRAIASLGVNGFTMRTEPRAIVDSYYRAADLFVLASLREGFGRVYVEAMALGLPCVAHDYLTSRFILGSYGIFGNLREPGILSDLVQRELSMPDLPERRIERHRAAYQRFSWDMLAPSYIEMLTRVSQKVGLEL